MLRQSFLLVITPLLRFLFRCVSFFRSKKHLLLVCNGPLMADYLSEFHTMFSGDSRLHFKVVLPEYLESPAANGYMRKMLPFPVVSHRWAKVMSWDLIIAADHCWPNLVDCKWNPTIFLCHGIESGKLVKEAPHGFDSSEAVHGAPYGFGRWALTPDERRPRYSRMFAVSVMEQRFAVKQTPLLMDTIVVTGSLKADKVLAMLPQRDEIRRLRGFNEDDTVVLVMSTWGPNCLYHRLGNAIVEQALHLKDKLSFIFTMHPNMYRPVATSERNERNWGEYMKTFNDKGFVVLEASEEFESSLVACDVVLTDHTSAALYGVVLGRPMVYIPNVECNVEDGSLVSRLKSISPVLSEDASDLYERIVEAKGHYPLEKLAEIADEITSFPGGAVARTREEVYGLLNLR